MDSHHCRRKANEFWSAAETARDNLPERAGWLLLANVWCSLADHLDETESKARKAALNLGEPLCDRLDTSQSAGPDII
jgi:hypothetical protein